MEYKDFLYSKSHLKHGKGFEPLFVPDFLYDFQKYLVEWVSIDTIRAICCFCQQEYEISNLKFKGIYDEQYEDGAYSVTIRFTQVEDPSVDRKDWMKNERK